MVSLKKSYQVFLDFVAIAAITLGFWLVFLGIMIGAATLAGALFGGCGMPPANVPSQAALSEADQIVWFGIMGAPGGRPAPNVRWVTKLDCSPDTDGVNLGWTVPQNMVAGKPTDDTGFECVAGLWHVDLWLADVAAPIARPLHEGALVHEYTHAGLGVLGVRDGDPDHLDPTWTKPDGWVSRGNAALAAVGE